MENKNKGCFVYTYDDVGLLARFAAQSLPFYFHLNKRHHTSTPFSLNQNYPKNFWKRETNKYDDNNDEENVKIVSLFCCWFVRIAEEEKKTKKNIVNLVALPTDTNKKTKRKFWTVPVRGTHFSDNTEHKFCLNQIPLPIYIIIIICRYRYASIKRVSAREKKVKENVKNRQYIIELGKA